MHKCKTATKPEPCPAQTPHYFQIHADQIRLPTRPQGLSRRPGEALLPMLFLYFCVLSYALWTTSMTSLRPTEVKPSRKLCHSSSSYGSFRPCMNKVAFSCI